MVDEQSPFRDAEAWLAERGIERDRLDVAPAPPEDPTGNPTATPASQVAAPHGPAAGEVSVREAQRVAEQAAADRQLQADEQAAAPGSGDGLEDEISRAVAFLRRSTAGAPQTARRLEDKLRERGHGDAVVARAIERAHRERLIDDRAMADALVEEKRRAGHAPARIRRDLRKRGFGDEVLDEVLAAAEAEDPEAAAYAVAAERAARLTGVAAETAFRRVVGHVARRGYPEALARKVAREAVFSSRDPERTATR